MASRVFIHRSSWESVTPCTSIYTNYWIIGGGDSVQEQWMCMKQGTEVRATHTKNESLFSLTATYFATICSEGTKTYITLRILRAIAPNVTERGIQVRVFSIQRTIWSVTYLKLVVRRDVPKQELTKPLKRMHPNGAESNESGDA